MGFREDKIVEFEEVIRHTIELRAPLMAELNRVNAEIAFCYNDEIALRRLKHLRGNLLGEITMFSSIIELKEKTIAHLKNSIQKSTK